MQKRAAAQMAVKVTVFEGRGLILSLRGSLHDMLLIVAAL